MDSNPTFNFLDLQFLIKSNDFYSFVRRVKKTREWVWEFNEFNIKINFIYKSYKFIT